MRFALSSLFPHVLRCHDILFSFICTLSGHFFLVVYQNVFNRKLSYMSNFISSQNIIIDVIDESTPNVKYSHTCLKHFHTETKGYPAYLFM